MQGECEEGMASDDEGKEAICMRWQRMACKQGSTKLS